MGSFFQCKRGLLTAVPLNLGSCKIQIFVCGFNFEIVFYILWAALVVDKAIV